MRTFQRGEDRFWAIARQGTSVTVHFGKVGGKAQVRTTVSKPEVAARLLYQRMIRDKVRDGYLETTPPPVVLQSTGQALESALVENPDDVAGHMAFADWLSEQTEPSLQLRGEFIRVQLQLENTRLSDAERRKLLKREKQLRTAGEHEWLGHRLADYLLEGGGDELFFTLTGEWKIPKSLEYRRGWLDKVEIPVLTDRLATVLATTPALRLLRTLIFKDVASLEDPFAQLASTTNLANVRTLVIEDGDADGQVSDLVASLPRIEEIVLEARSLNCGRLFTLKNLDHLRVLRVVEAQQYPIRELAGNLALGRLERLELIPPGLVEDDQPHLRLAAIRALVRAKHLVAMKSLILHRSDMGDAGCREIADSGILGRIQFLDLTLGCVSDEGARILSGGKDFAHLKILNLTGNRLTEVGMAALRRKGLELIVADQQQPDERGHYDDDYLYDAADSEFELMLDDESE